MSCLMPNERILSLVLIGCNVGILIDSIKITSGKPKKWTRGVSLELMVLGPKQVKSENVLMRRPDSGFHENKQPVLCVFLLQLNISLYSCVLHITMSAVWMFVFHIPSLILTSFSIDIFSFVTTERFVSFPLQLTLYSALYTTIS